MATDDKGTTDDSGNPFGEFLRGKSDEDLDKAVAGLARMLWLYFRHLREQGFSEATAMVLVLQLQDNVSPTT